MSVRMSVRLSVRLCVRLSVRLCVRQPRLGGNVIFSATNWDIAPIFCVQIPLLNEHLFCKHFVRLSVVSASKGCATYGCFLYKNQLFFYIWYPTYVYRMDAHDRKGESSLKSKILSYIAAQLPLIVADGQQLNGHWNCLLLLKKSRCLLTTETKLWASIL